MRNYISSNRCMAILLALAVSVTGYQSALAQSATLNERYTIQGFSQPIRHAALSGATSGIVASRDAVEGSKVRMCECLVQIDHRVHDQKLELARLAKESFGELKIAEAELDASKSRHARLKELAARNHATDVELLQAKEALAVAQCSVQRAMERLSQQEADYARLLAEYEQFFVRAPFDGVVIEFKKQLGEYVGPGESVVCTIADISELSVDFLVPRAFRSEFTVGDRVEVAFTIANRIEQGTISYVSPFPNGETNTYKVKVTVKNAKGELSAGERCLLQSMPAIPGDTSPAKSDQLTQRSR